MDRNEQRRVDALHAYKEPGFPPLRDAALNRIVELTAGICETPIAEINLLDDTREWKKAVFGFDSGTLPRELSFCNVTITKNDLHEIPDMSKDLFYKSHPFVTGPWHVGFYAGFPLITPEGEAIGALCVVDLKPRHLSDMQRNAIRVLGGEVMARLQLERQNRDLEKALDQKKEILRMLQHDIRNPLSGILAAADEIAASGPVEVADLARLILRSGSRLLQMTDRALQDDAPETVGTAPETTDIGVRLQQIVELNALSARSKSIQVSVSVTGSRLTAIPARAWDHVATNLLSNALKFTPDQGRVHVAVVPLPDGGVCFSIDDEGPGLPADAFERVRAGLEVRQTAGTRGESGFGLGLPLILSLLEPTGATISVTKSRFDGARIEIRFPAVNQP